MPEYRCNYLAGGCFFFTVNLADRMSDLLLREIDIIRAAIRTTLRRQSFTIDAWVVLPEHMHCLWTLPEGDSDYSGRWCAIKKTVSKALPGPANARGERDIWQKRFWEHTIRDGRDYRAHMDYIHFNPVKHGYVSHPADWPYSSFRKCVERGLCDASWGKQGNDLPAETGERA
jgi:putative transposase